VTRIIGGNARGRRLQAPRGDKTRPTASRVKQTLFDVLTPRLRGCRFLDLFAGSGAVGLEALSRGAAEVALVESDRHAATIIRDNAALLTGAGGRVDVRCVDYRQGLTALARQGRHFDVVFVDPPYESDFYEPALEQLARLGLLAAGATVVVEHFHKRALRETIEGLVRERQVRVGDHMLSFLRPPGFDEARAGGEV
jgi:16S rRNA (guanine966-N2)-methyltransferase